MAKHPGRSLAPIARQESRILDDWESTLNHRKRAQSAYNDAARRSLAVSGELLPPRAPRGARLLPGRCPMWSELAQYAF
jgi:hypothetical protein